MFWKATAFEYKHRYVLHTLLFVLGFWAPWNYWLHIDPAGPNAHVWGLLAINLMRSGMNISAAFQAVLIVAIVCAAAGAGLRMWGTAYLGANVVQSGEMHTAGASVGAISSGVIEDGPYRFVRNPLYLGTWLHTLALALLMPRSGAVFAIVMIGVIQLRLILAEEPFLSAKLGAPYAAYCALVPRIFPALRPKVVAHGLVPRWGQAALGEIYFWGVALSFAVLGWGYDATRLIQAVIVWAGVSMVVRALAPKQA